MKATAHAPVGHPDGQAFRDSPSGTSSADRAAMHDRPAPTAAAEAQAVGAVLFRAHDAARHLENLLELEAPDPRVAELLRDAKRVRKSIAALLVDVAIADVALEGSG